MRYTLLVWFLLLSGSLPAALAQSPTTDELRLAHQLLQAEYALSRTGLPYVVIDLQDNLLHLKASGLLLESWPIDHHRRWAHPQALAAVTLERKSAFAQPQREVQVVNTPAPARKVINKPLKALELTDMPTDYRLHLANGTEISVRATPAGRFAPLRSALAISAWSLSRPLISNWKFLRGSPYNELALSLSARDARRLYWAFTEGTPCLIRPPLSAGAATAP